MKKRAKQSSDTSRQLRPGSTAGRPPEEECSLVIEELEARLTPDYTGLWSGGGNGGGGSPPSPPGRTIGWGC